MAHEQQREATIANFTLPESGRYSIIASGQNPRARGVYTLGLTMATTATLVSPPSSARPTSTPTHKATSAPKVTAILAPATTPDAPSVTQPLCTVASPTLNLRSGPGVAYIPPIGSLPQGAQLYPQARNADGSWIQVKVATSGQIGWVSASAQYLTCTFDVKTLPLGVIPPLPTATPTGTPTPTPVSTATPTPQPIAQAPSLQAEGLLISGVGNSGDLFGGVYVSPRAVSGSTNLGDGDPLIIRDPFYIEIYVYDPRVGTTDGDGIDRVEFTISCSNDGEYSHTERTARFCAFGGGEPTCTWVSGAAGSVLPGSDCQLGGDNNNIQIDAFPKNDRLRRGNWNFDIQPISSGGGQSGGDQSGGDQQQPTADLVAYIAQIGPNSTNGSVSDALVFQVIAMDPNVGNDDGAGIDNVQLAIYGPDGKVYERQENNAHYCAFGGGEPDCTVFHLNDNDHWPNNGPEIKSGSYNLVGTVHAKDGRTATVNGSVEIDR
jgi:uncharacterized protein YraI